MQTQLAIKIGVIFLIAFLILIPINMVKSKIYERQSYLDQAKQSVTTSWTGPQRLATPVLVIPYTQYPVRSESGFYGPIDTQKTRKAAYIMPDTSHVTGVVNLLQWAKMLDGSPRIVDDQQ